MKTFQDPPQPLPTWGELVVDENPFLTPGPDLLQIALIGTLIVAGIFAVGYLIDRGASLRGAFEPAGNRRNIKRAAVVR